MPVKPAAGMLTRLLRNSREDGYCRRWTGKTSRNGRSTEYPRMNIVVYGRTVTVAAHRIAAVLKEAGDANAADAYFTLMLSHLAELEVDHLDGCSTSLCVQMGHLEWRHKDEHLELTKARGQSFWRKKGPR